MFKVYVTDRLFHRVWGYAEHISAQGRRTGKRRFNRPVSLRL